MVKCGNVERKEPGSSHFKIWSVSDSKLVLDYRVEYVQCSRWESCLEMPGTLNRAPVSTFVTLTSLGYHRGVSLQLEVSVGAMSSLTSHIFSRVVLLPACALVFVLWRTRYLGRSGSEVTWWFSQITWLFTQGERRKEWKRREFTQELRNVTACLRAKSRWGPWPGGGHDVSSLASGSQAQQHSTSLRPSAFASILL